MLEKVLGYIEYLLGDDESCGNFFAYWNAKDVVEIINDAVRVGEANGFSHRTIALGIVAGAMVVVKMKAN